MDDTKESTPLPEVFRLLAQACVVLCFILLLGISVLSFYMASHPPADLRLIPHQTHPS